MFSHISTIIDKSTLQSLTRAESRWLHHHFMIVVPPVFFSEIIGDLGKTEGGKTSTGTGSGDARMLAGKIESHSICLNAEAMAVVRMELSGRIGAPDGRPVLDADVRRMPNGELGARIDSTPMQQVLQRWKDGDFIGMERAYAKLWRDRIEDIDLESLVRNSSKLQIKEIRSIDQAVMIVDQMLNPPNQNHHNIKMWLSILRVPVEIQKIVLKRWKAVGRPNAVEFIPFTYYMAKIDILFSFCVAHQLIGTRKSNVIDFRYFEYLPFCNVFSSGDKLHADIFPFLANKNQFFVSAMELKSALAELVAYYDNLPSEEKRKGSALYAKYPPLHMNNAVTVAYDRVWPDWRDWAVRPPDPPLSPEDERALLARLKANYAAFDRAKSMNR